MFKLLHFIVPGVEFLPTENNPRHFKAIIDGPEDPDSPYHGGKFLIEMFAKDYPEKAPLTFFRNPIYHPNMNTKGQICMSTLKPYNPEKRIGWKKEEGLRSVLLGLQTLLQMPCEFLDDPLDTHICAHFTNDRVDAFKKAREWTRLYASADVPYTKVAKIEQLATSIYDHWNNSASPAQRQKAAEDLA